MLLPDIIPTIDKFFYFFEFTNTKKTNWVSMNSVSGRGILNLCTSSYKNFKDKFFCLCATENISDLLDNILLYWTSNPHNYGGLDFEFIG